MGIPVACKRFRLCDYDFFFFFFFLQFTMNQSKFEEFLHVAPLIKKTTEKTEPIGACERLPTSLLDYR